MHLRDLKAERGFLGLKDTFWKPFGIPFFFQRDFLSLHEGLGPGVLTAFCLEYTMIMWMLVSAARLLAQ